MCPRQTDPRRKFTISERAREIRGARAREEKNPPIYNIIIGHLVRQLRELRKLSQKELALRCELSASMISRIESGRANMKVSDLSRFAEVFHVNKHALLNIVDLIFLDWDEACRKLHTRSPCLLQWSVGKLLIEAGADLNLQDARKE